MITRVLSAIGLCLAVVPGASIAAMPDDPECGSVSPLHAALGDGYFELVDKRFDDTSRASADLRAAIDAQASSLVAQVAAQRLRVGSGERQRCLPGNGRHRYTVGVERFSLTDIDITRHGDRLLVIHAWEETRRNLRHATMDLPLPDIIGDDLVSSDVVVDTQHLVFRRLARRPAAGGPDFDPGNVLTQTGRPTYLYEVSTFLEQRGDTLEMVEHTYVNGRLGGWARWRFDLG